MDQPARPSGATSGDDLSALAWVHGELRRSLENAHKALRRHLKESETIGGSDVDSVDPALLRGARMQIHQGVGALELVGLPTVADVLRSGEAAVQRLAARPALVDAAAVESVERVSFAVLDFLARQLAGKPVSPVMLFPQYRAAQQLAAADRIHPADLWPLDFQWHELPAEPAVAARASDDEARGAMEGLVLALMRSADRGILEATSDFCAELGAGAPQRHEAALWRIAAAVFQAQAAGALAADVYSKRLASRLLAQLRLAVRGQHEVSERLAQDLLFFCAHAASAPGVAPRLDAVRRAWQLDRHPTADYETPRLGRFDPAAVALARKRVAGAREAWSTVAAGELHRIAALGEPFALVGESLARLLPNGQTLAQALQGAAAQTAASGQAPAPPLAMEVATAILYLDASIEDGELEHPQLGARVQRLAQRIDEARSGGTTHPLEPWMEELYRRVSDRQTMGSVVQELRATLSEIERQVDQYFRQPSERQVLAAVPGQLGTMRGVLSVLGLDQASQAVLHMRDDIDALAAAEADAQRAAQAGTFDRVADNLGALGFLVDMLGVQPALARTLFRFDPASGLLAAVMGAGDRTATPVPPEAAPAAAADAPAVVTEAAGEAAVEAAAAAAAPLPEQAAELAHAAGRADVPAAEIERRLERLAQQATAAEQPALARTASSALGALRGASDDVRRHGAREDLARALAAFAPAVAPLPPPAPAAPVRVTPPAAPGDTGLEDDAEMREIFIEEAREVVGDAGAALLRLADAPDSAGDMTVVRRAFHTLKGSSRMVGLRDFGDAAWACEQLYNARLADRPRADPPLRQLSTEALAYLGAWVDAIEAGRDDGHRSAAVVRSADLLRLEDTLLPITPAASAAPAQPVAPPEESVARADAVPAAPDDATLPPLRLEPIEAAAPQEVPAEPAHTELPELVADIVDESPEPGPQPELVPEGVPEGVPELIDMVDLSDLSGLGEAPAASPDFDAIEPLALPEVTEVPVPRTDVPDSLAMPGELSLPAWPESSALPELAELAQWPDLPELPQRLEPSSAVGAVPDELAHIDFDFLPAAAPVAADAADAADARTLTDDVPPLPTAADLDFGLAGTAPEPATQDALPSEVSFDLDLGALEDEPAAGAAQDAPVPAVSELPPPEADHAGVDLPLALAPALPEPPRSAHLPAPVFELDIGLGEPAAPRTEPLQAELEGVAPDAAGAADATDATPEPDDSAAATFEDEQVKAIGPLRIAIPLFNIYLNEADELSRRLLSEIGEWSVDALRHPVPETSEALAHKLAGSSATVGYADLSALARALEHALGRSHAMGHGREGEAELFGDCAEEIRRLLHQFAAGFLRPAPELLLERLADHERWPDAPAAAEAPSSGLGDLSAAVPLAATVSMSAFTPLDAASLATPAAPADAFDDDQDIDAVDDVDAELFPIFEEEAGELLPQLQARLREWHDHPTHRDAGTACMRTLHTFKGGARLAGAMRLGEMAHRLETAVEHLAARDSVAAAQIEPLLMRCDAMTGAFEALRGAAPVVSAAEHTAAREVAAGVEQVAEAATEPASEAISAATGEAAPEVPPREPAQERAASASAAAAAAVPAAAHAATTIDWTRFSVAAALPEQADESRAGAAGAAAAVRVRAGVLDRLVNQAGEVAITRERIAADMRQLQGSLGELTDSLERMRRQLRDIELQAETQIGTRMETARAAGQTFDPLEMDRFTRFQELTRFMAESVNDVATLQRSLQRTVQSTEDELAAQARLTRDLQDDLLRTRMVEFESLAERLYRTVRQAAKETGKQVRLDIVGGAIEIDRGVLERMVGSFEHLLRNSVAHGIESPEARQTAGKDASGRIQVSVAQSGNEVAVEFADDGAGFDYERIRARAVERGLLAHAEPGAAELAQLLFQPGFSTADTVTGLAGRGVGLDVVRAEIDAMGGRIETASERGAGTRFRLLMPLTTAVTQVVMLRSGARAVAVPSTLVETVRRVTLAETERAYATGVLEHGGEPVPFFWLAALLHAGTRGEITGRAQTVVVVRSAAQRVAVHVDEVLGNQEVVVKNVGPQLARLPGLAGVTLLPSGAVALIYNPVALATLYADGARRLMRQSAATSQPAAAAVLEREAPLVLVVDDSLTVRRVTQRLLLREGYRVVTAKDGLEALQRLAEERPAVLLSDIEMPRMDGFDLLRNVRADERLAGLPTIMITSRTAQKHRDFAAELGADHYLGKPYAEEELLALVARYAGADITA